MQIPRSVDAFLAVAFLVGAVVSPSFLKFQYAPLMFWLCVVLCFLFALFGLRSKQTVPKMCCVMVLILLFLYFVSILTDLSHGNLGGI